MCKHRNHKNRCQPNDSTIDKIITIASVPIVALVAVPVMIVQTVVN